MMPLVEKMLQNQLTLERTNHAIYRSMADELENLGWDGCADYMRKSSDEELEHADKIASFLVDRNIDPFYDTVQSPPELSEELPDYFKNAYAAEQKTTASIMELYNQALAENEYLVTEFLHWFLAEQVKSEREVWDIIQMLEATNEWRLIDEKVGKLK